jgi:hypothetical protein
LLSSASVSYCSLSTGSSTAERDGSVCQVCAHPHVYKWCSPDPQYKVQVQAPTAKVCPQICLHLSPQLWTAPNGAEPWKMALKFPITHGCYKEDRGNGIESLAWSLDRDTQPVTQGCVLRSLQEALNPVGPMCSRCHSDSSHCSSKKVAPTGFCSW